MLRRATLKKSTKDNGFETGVFKGLNSGKEDEYSDKSNDSDIGEEDDDESSDDELLVNSDDENVDETESDNDFQVKPLSNKNMLPKPEDDDDEDDDNDDDDEAPEDVSFSASKTTALEQIKSAIKQIDEAKLKAKLKRKHLDEKYKEQKRKKLKDLSDTKLPDDFLAELPEKEPKSKTTKETKAIKAKSSSDSDEDIGSLADTEDDLKDTDMGDDYIPLESDRLGGVEVLALKEEKKNAQPVSNTVLNFREQILYGKKIPRESTKSKFAKMIKRKARFK